MRVFITGGTGYMGRELIPVLHRAGHEVRALARPGSVGKVAAGATPAVGNALDAATFVEHVAGCETFVHLVGAAHPAPWKGREFRAVDLVSARASIDAARRAGVRHFVYVSVAHPAPVMKAYIAVRVECERLLEASGIAATILRPWYVLGPGHWWPVVLLPAYRLLERLPARRDGARRLGLVTRAQMIAALAWAVANPIDAGARILDVPAISQLGHNEAMPPAVGRALH